jgi:phosphoenolpyruvate synthase/pyruvate phosphate dikinase
MQSFIIKRTPREPAIGFPNFLALISSVNKLHELINLNLSLTGFIYLNNKRNLILGTEDDVKNAENAFLEKILKDKNFISNIKKNFHKERKKLLYFVRNNLNEKQVKSYSDKKLFNCLEKYFKLYYSFNFYVIPLMLLASNKFETYLRTIIKEDIIFNMPYKTFLQEFEMDYYNKIKQLSSYFSKRWGWIPFDYVGPEEFDQNYFLEKMNININEYNAKFEKINQDNKQRNILLNKYPKKIQRLIKDYYTIANLQDKRKAIVTISHVYLQKYLFKEISLRSKIKMEHLWIMLPNEIKEIFLNKKNYLKEKYDLRINKGLIIFKENKYFAYEGEHELIDLFISKMSKSKNLKGIVASKGYAKGKVKICFSVKDTLKVKKGDILVAPMTYPSFIDAMNKASAFITDEGGITSHAAIISREMKKPCIIGTKNATSILKDNQLIEVDADNNVINTALK